MPESLPEIIKTQESIFNMQICTTIPPEKKDTINNALQACGLNISGTTHGWCLDYETEPVQCAEYPNRWHYLCNC